MTYSLVLNSGSSSIKFQLVDPTAGADAEAFASGLVERIGEEMGSVTLKHAGEKHTLDAPIADHSAGLSLAFGLMSEHGIGIGDVEISAVGHRLVHGGDVFSRPVVITDEVLDQMRELVPLAPLHNPANIDGVVVARELLPDVPHVGVFDTGFFHNLPEAARRYAVKSEVADRYGIRRYGFHGTSHEYVSKQIPEVLGRPLEDINQITLHLGNGASCAAIRGGEAIDTSMGLTPLAGLVMGTRSGDIDPGIIFHLARNGGMSIDEIDHLLNRESGVKGFAGVNDFRVLHEERQNGNKDAQLGYEVYIHQLRRFIGAYMIALGRVDAIVFTAGVGENDEYVRADALADLEVYGIKIDHEVNNRREKGIREISTPDSKVKVFVVPTNEELAIARYAAQLAENEK